MQSIARLVISFLALRRYTYCGVEQSGQLVGLITRRSSVQIRSPRPNVQTVRKGGFFDAIIQILPTVLRILLNTVSNALFGALSGFWLLWTTTYFTVARMLQFLPNLCIGVISMPKIMSSTALRNGYNDVSEWCHETMEPVFVTKNGSGDLAVMSIDAYEQLVSDADLQYQLAVGRRAAVEGRIQDARSVSSSLREKYGL